MLFSTKPEKQTKKNGAASGRKAKEREQVPDFLLPPGKKGKTGKGSRPYSLEEMMFYDDVIYDEW
ncbi:MAG: hypothetical protein IKF90_00685 [Parasporobacterium sp.]|nr:hypothetical protein [Parasporobacterium sp.]